METSGTPLTTPGRGCVAVTGVTAGYPLPRPLITSATLASGCFSRGCENTGSGMMVKVVDLGV